MTQHDLDYNPPFTKSEKQLQKLSDCLFIAWGLILIFPCILWIWLPNELPSNWNDLGQPIQWSDKPIVLAQAFLPWIITTPFYYVMRESASNPSALRYLLRGSLGKITPQNIDKKYRLGREMMHILMAIMNFSYLCGASFMCQAYFSGGLTMYRPLMTGIVGGISLLVFAVHHIRITSA